LCREEAWRSGLYRWSEADRQTPGIADGVMIVEISCAAFNTEHHVQTEALLVIPGAQIHDRDCS